MELKDNVGTFTLNGVSKTIIAEWGIRNVSVRLVSGIVTVKGTQSLGSDPSTPIAVTAANPINISFNFSIDGYTIDASAGVAEVITGR